MSLLRKFHGTPLPTASLWYSPFFCVAPTAASPAPFVTIVSYLPRGASLHPCKAIGTDGHNYRIGRLDAGRSSRLESAACSATAERSRVAKKRKGRRAQKVLTVKELEKILRRAAKIRDRKSVV